MPRTPMSECRVSYNGGATLGFRAIARITVVNDNRDFLALMDEVLASLNHDVVPVSAKDATLDSIASTQPDVLIVDLHINGDPRKGWDVAMAAHEHRGLDQTPLILCTGDHSFLRERDDQIRAMPGVHPLAKPFSIDDVDQLLGRLLEHSDPASAS